MMNQNKESTARDGCWVPSEHALKCETCPSSPHNQERNAELVMNIKRAVLNCAVGHRAAHLLCKISTALV